MWTAKIGPKNRQDRARVIERFLENNNDGDKPYGLMKKRHMLKRRDALSKTPAAANTMMKTMKQVFVYAEQYEDLPVNPCAGIDPLPEGPGYHTWTDAEIAQFRAYHPTGAKADLALDLAFDYAQRIYDVHRLGPQSLTE